MSIRPSSKLRRAKFVREVEGELQRRGFQRAGNLPGVMEWRRSSAWLHVGLGFRVEIRAHHELRAIFKNGCSRVRTADTLRDACSCIDAAELDAEFGV